MTGSVQVKNGKYYAVINAKDENGKRKQIWRVTPFFAKGNKKKAQRFLRELLKEYEIKENLTTSDCLFSDYVVNWLMAVAKLKLDENTYDSYWTVTNSYIKPYFEPLKLKLSDITRNDLQKYVNYMYEKGRLKGDGGLSAKSIKHHIVVMKQALTEAVKDNILLTNPCDHITMPKTKKYESSFYTAEQINSLFETIKDDRLYPLVYVTVVLGLRRSEVLGLKWDSINFSTNTVTIRHTVVPAAHSRPLEKDSTKNKSSYRTFPVSEDIMLIFKQLKQTEKKIIIYSKANTLKMIMYSKMQEVNLTDRIL